MRIRAVKIDKKDFNKYGIFLNPYDCGEPVNPGDTFPYFNDRLGLRSPDGSAINLSILVCKKRLFEFDITENHFKTEEIIGGFNEDVVFHVASRNNNPDISKFKAYILPRFCWIKLKKGVFHHAPFVIDADEAMGWVFLPAMTINNDAKIYNLEEKIEIIF